MTKLNHVKKFAELEGRAKHEIAVATFEKLSCSQQNEIVDVIEDIESGIKRKGGRIGRQSTMELITALGLFLCENRKDERGAR